MFKLSHTTFVLILGVLCFSIGSILLPLGLNNLIDCLLLENRDNSHPLLNMLSPFVGGLDTAALVLIAIALFLGYIKGTRIFAKSALNTVTRICTLENPASITSLCTPSYLVLLLALCGLLFLLYFIPEDLSGIIEITLGSASIHGAMTFFRQSFSVHKNANAQNSCRTL